ncbi:MAG: peptidoglycan editing factor PgeF [Pseudomonadota bacterium]|nr:peptidoglycan editing factor PgeF [Pseudomonadota bacterium]
MSLVLHADWPAPPGVHALTTLRHGAGVSQPPFDSFNMGMRCGDDAAAVMANRRQLVEECVLPSEPHWLRQVHGVNVVRFNDAPAPGSTVAGTDHEVAADAAITCTPGTVLAILTADCLPVVLAARDGSELAAAHAGWRGLANGVLETTVAAMQTSAEQLVAWLGPAAGPQAYEIDATVRDAFLDSDARADAAFVATREGHWRVDLYALARMRLMGAGIAGHAIRGGGLCTISDPQRYFSHRRDQRSGRMATVAWIEG